jgi:hypothetical protein
MPSVADRCANAGHPKLLLPISGCGSILASLGGHRKHRRWVDHDGEESDDSRPSSYLDVSPGEGAPAVTAPTNAKTRPASGSGHAGADLSQQGHGCRWRKRSRPRPQLVNTLPVQPMEGHVPARQRLGRRGRVPAHMRLGPRCGAQQRISAPDIDGWCEVLS